jgi:hypothetical protein
MKATLNDEQWAEIDAHILRSNTLAAIIRIRRFSGVDIRDAIDILIERYRRLRAERPSDFPCSDEEYWRNTYS